jgi:hypothetical protein
MRITPMCTVDCPLCDRAVPFEPDDEEFDCPTCAVRVAVVEERQPHVLALAA